MLIYVLTLATPVPLSAAHQRDIGCVATLAMIADEQRRGVVPDAAIPDVRESGRRWAPVVGERVMRETGQPRELVAVAMTEAARAIHARLRDDAAVSACIATMNSELAIADIANVPLPKPVRGQ